ncbi:unnamed protein product, partial [Vitis vinifera]|uniref:Uncharacterized protein n=1 Tax=Vitis vinifera TaxID=29760 RepID=D7SXC1_VITVI
MLQRGNFMDRAGFQTLFRWLHRNKSWQPIEITWSNI